MCGTVAINRAEHAYAVGGCAEKQPVTRGNDPGVYCNCEGRCQGGQSRDDILFMELYANLLQTNLPERKSR